MRQTKLKELGFLTWDFNNYFVVDLFIVNSFLTLSAIADILE